MKSLAVSNGIICDMSGRSVFLRGVNLGGWLMLEGYILGGRNIPEHQFKKTLQARSSRISVQSFYRRFRKSFITGNDFARIKQLGLTCVRIPFHYRLIHDRTHAGIHLLDTAIAYCNRLGLYVILDMHAAPGSQNADWHSDSSGRAQFWEHAAHRQHAVRLWRFLSRRYRKTPAIAGYDLINEPVTRKTAHINRFYNDTIRMLRQDGDNRLIFLEGNRWAQDIDFIKPWSTDNIVLSIHYYLPLEYTFNLEMGSAYPGVINRQEWNKKRLIKTLAGYVTIQQRLKLPVYVGEFGINTRCYACAHELKILDDMLAVFKHYGWHWTYWTYKTIALGIFPNGILQYLKNPEWVNRQGPECGWETYSRIPQTKQKALFDGFTTRHFVKHAGVARLLRTYQ
ncbi:MAG: cellulase family glycosylhydrolase [Elusimicrobia bacterium]|nr:cellulase family glycosylhydrolase [Elusimicrobiota bacterium]MBD3411679.1 cellulase family glycosylhydrolase [Elusimicrobiota bacterium]